MHSTKVLDAHGQAPVVGFGGVDDVRFRGTVSPGKRLLIIVKGISLKRRIATFDAQELVDGKIIFQGKIIGIPV